MARVVFMGTPDFAVPALRALIATQTVVGVVTQPDRPAGRGRRLRSSPVKLVAQAAGIPLYQPRSLKSEEAAEPLRAWSPDIFIVAAFAQILRPHVLYLPPLGSLNVHASLLPRWRGAAPIQYSILAGDKETGISLMQMDKGLDTGLVFARQAIPIGAEETAATLHDRLAELGGAMLERYLPQIVSGELQAVPQVDELSTYAPRIKKEDGLIDWREPAERLDRMVRAFFPWPGTFTYWQNRILKILSARPYDGVLPGGEVGQVIVTDDRRVVVCTGEGGLELIDIQLAGKRSMPVASFLPGNEAFVGARLSMTKE